MKDKITKRADDYSRWYTDVIVQSKLADYSPVKGCMVIRPNGFALWEKMQAQMDRMFKDTGHVNAYFPVFIPESFMQKEAEHVEGFSPECAVVTHAGGKDLEESLMVRPTSETIINSMYSKWINSYRDLPVLINQWCNVVRWEMRTRLFLRTTEFLWQEGHTAHATYEEAEDETIRMLGVYADFAEKYMAIPVLRGIKSEAEKFAGALHTYCIEAMMGDKKSLQSGTSHNLGQNFAKAFNTKYQTKDGNQEYVWQTSWGVSTRLIGAIIMVHGDDQGLIMPPKLAPNQIVMVPIWRDDEAKDKVLTPASKITEELKKDFSVKFDDRDQYSPGWKFNEWEMLGVPIRIEIGPKDVENESVVMVRRDSREKIKVKWEDVPSTAGKLLDEIHNNLFDRALNFRKDNTFTIDDYADFKDRIENEGGFYSAHWCGSGECEEKVKNETMATIRLIPMNQEREEGMCLYCGNASKERVIFAKAY